MTDNNQKALQEIKDVMDAMGYSASQDPVQSLENILRNHPDETDPLKDRDRLLKAHETRFNNRRRIAYTCLWSILAIAIATIFGAYWDGFTCTIIAGAKPAEPPAGTVAECTQIMASMEGVSGILIAIITVLVTIVISYYVSSTIKPSS